MQEQFEIQKTESAVLLDRSHTVLGGFEKEVKRLREQRANDRRLFVAENTLQKEIIQQREADAHQAEERLQEKYMELEEIRGQHG